MTVGNRTTASAAKERQWQRIEPARVARLAVAATIIATLAPIIAAAQLIDLAGSAPTFVKQALDNLGATYSEEAAMWATPESAQILIMSNDGGTETPVDYSTHLANGRHVLMIGGSNWEPFYSWVDGYLTRDASSGWHQSNDCTSDWNIGSPDPATQYLPATYEFPDQATSYHMLHFAASQPVGTVLLGQTCHAAPDNYIAAVRTYPGGGTFTYLAFDLGQYSAGSTSADFVEPFLQGYLATHLSCGDGVVDTFEGCDDNNTSSGDGCSAGCAIEDCYGCTGAPSTCFPLPDGSTCDDGQFCNGGDTCSSATCTVHDGDPCTGGGECGDTCNEGTNTCADPPYTPCTADTNTCTDDYCDGAGACTHPDTYYTPCDNGLFCDGADYCYGGACDYHVGDPCTYAECNTVCDEPSDVCTPSPIDSFCSDDGNPCTTDACDGAGLCAHPPGPSGIPCPSDGAECTADECDGAGACGHPALPNTTPCTSDGNECTNDNCDGAGACAHPAVTDGSGCDDDDLCTQTDQCAAGTCVGSNEVVCTPAACFEAESCDPTSGTCTTCPPGYTQGGGGCQKTYAIDASLLDNMVYACDPTNQYNPCDSTPFGFHWTDTGDASVGAVIRVDIALETGVDCSYAPHDVGLNGTSVGSYPFSNSCTCPPPHAPQLLADVDYTPYVKGGANLVLIATSSCSGLSTDTNGAFAVVTVTYADPGPQLAVESGCRTSLKSKFKYKNNATDAKDKLLWKWIKGSATTGMEFADPTTSADYQVCVFGQSSGAPTLLFGAEVAAGPSQWSAAGSSSYKYNDPTAAVEGVSKILLKGGAANKSKAILKGKGAGLDDPTLPLAMGTTGLLVQLTNESTGICWQSQFPIASVTQSAAGITGSLP